MMLGRLTFLGGKRPMFYLFSGYIVVLGALYMLDIPKCMSLVF